MPKKNPAKLEVKPVAWAGEIVTKYQGFITVTRPDGKEKVMTGEPMSSEEAARQSLKNEILQRRDDVNQALDAVKDIL